MVNELLTLPETEPRAETVAELLADYQERKKERQPIDVSLLEFELLGPEQTISSVSRRIDVDNIDARAVERDTYNPSRAFKVDDKTVTAVRVESRGAENDSAVEFFELDEKGHGRLIENAPVLEGYQDPFYEDEIGGQKILGAVKIEEIEGELYYKTELFKFKNHLTELQKFADGPQMMKDIRLLELEQNCIGVFIRPQGDKYGRGQIGYFEIGNLDELQDDLLNWQGRAKIFDNLFAPDEWGGVNDLHLLKNGKVGLIGHIARLVHDDETDAKEYYATTAVFDPSSQEISNLEIIMAEEDLEEQLGLKFSRKNPTLKSVLYPGGTLRHSDGTMEFYAGVGDTRAVEFRIQDPLTRHENQ